MIKFLRNITKRVGSTSKLEKTIFWTVCGSLLLLILWEVVAIWIGSKDNKNIAVLKQHDAFIVRGSSFSPSAILMDFPDDLGKVQSVSLKNTLINGDIAGAIGGLRSCLILHFDNCNFGDDEWLIDLVFGERYFTYLSFANKSASDTVVMRILLNKVKIKYMVLHDVDVSDNVVDQIAALSGLVTIHIYKTKISPEGVFRLRLLRPDLEVVEGDFLNLD